MQAIHVSIDYRGNEYDYGADLKPTLHFVIFLSHCLILWSSRVGH